MATRTKGSSWNGDRVTGDVIKAAKRAATETTFAAVAPAKRRTRVDTGALQGSIQARAAIELPNGIIQSIVGSFNINYALYQERGWTTSTGKHVEGTFYLERAAEEIFPSFPSRLQRLLG